MADDPRYAIGDLADLGGVSRRTVRYYVQEGLLPAPFGLGRGNHYGPEHLNQLVRVKAMQEAGRTLDEIRQTLNGRSSRTRSRQGTETVDRELTLPRSLWRRVTLAPGVEIQISGDIRLPPPGKLDELAAWCRQNLQSDTSPGHNPANHFGEEKDEDADA